MLKSTLESMIDDVGLAMVLDTISDICCEKADHIRASYSDEALAAQWEKAGRGDVEAINAISPR